MIRAIVPWLVAFALTSLAVAAVGESPTLVFKVLLASAFGGVDNISATLYYATPLLFTGTAVCLALEAGLFNIGAEGQLYMGALFAASWGILTRNSTYSTTAAAGIVFLGIAFSFLGGALWGGLAGYLRVKRKTHEVIVTILLNFIAAAIVNWAVLNPLKNTETQALETLWIHEAVRLPKLWAQATYGFPLAVLTAALVLFTVRKTWWGFRVRATGKNHVAAEVEGMSPAKHQWAAFTISGGIAGMVGFNEVFANSHRLLDGFSPGFGFTGLAIALLSRGNFIALVAACILFGALYKGSLDLDLETEKVTRDLSAVIQALVLLALALRGRKK